MYRWAFSQRLLAISTFFFCPPEKSSIFFSNCTRSKSSFRRMALNRLSSRWNFSAKSDNVPARWEVSLGHIGEDQAGRRGHGPGVLDGGAGQQFQKAALAAAVSPVQEDPLSLPDVEGYRRTDSLSVIEDGHLG